MGIVFSALLAMERKRERYAHFLTDAIHWPTIWHRSYCADVCYSLFALKEHWNRRIAFNFF